MYTINYNGTKVGIFKNNILIEEEEILNYNISDKLYDSFVGSIAAIQGCLLAYKHKINVFSMYGWNKEVSYYLESCFGKSFSLKFAHVNQKSEFWLTEINKMKNRLFSNIQYSQKEVEKFIIFLFAGIEKIDIKNPEAIEISSERIKKNINIIEFNDNKSIKEQLIDYNLFTDASIRTKESITTIANIIYNKDNIELTNYRQKLDYNIYQDINKAEIYAIIKGLQVAFDMGITKIRIFTDSLCAIEKIGNYNPYYKNEYSNIINSLLIETQKYQQCDFIHILRKHNTIADSLTKF